jgi:hypothetical protein
MIQPLVNLFRPHWTRFRSAARVVTAVASALILTISLKLGDWLVLADPADTAAAHHHLAGVANHWTRVGVEITIAGICVEVLFRLWRLSRDWKRDGTAGVSMTIPAAS